MTCDESGIEVVERRGDHPRPHRTQRRGASREIRHAVGLQPRVDEGLLDLGGEVDEGMQRFQGVVATQGEFVGDGTVHGCTH